MLSKFDPLSFKEIEGVYDLILHNYGPNKIIATAHIQVKDNTKARDIHILTRNMATGEVSCQGDEFVCRYF